MSMFATRIRFERSNEIGAFCRLTNSFCLVASDATEEFYDILENAFYHKIPVIQTTVGCCRAVGRLCVGNKYGLLLPDIITDIELEVIKQKLPDNVEFKIVSDKMSALGNVILCNDNIALVHPDIDKETEELIGDVLKVDVIYNMASALDLPGSHAIITNHSGLVYPSTPTDQIEELSEILNVPIKTSTVNNMSICLGSGIASNDTTAFLGINSTPKEILAVEHLLERPEWHTDWYRWYRSMKKSAKYSKRRGYYWPYFEWHANFVRNKSS